MNSPTMSPMRPLTAIAASALALLASFVSFGSAQALLYDLDFGTEPHTPGFPPVVGDDPPVRHVVSEIDLGDPLVVTSLGAMTDQPCQFDAWDGVADQISLRLDDLPASDFYSLEVDVLVESAEAGGDFTVFFDAPAVRRIDFHSDGTVTKFVGGGGEVPIGAYTLGTIVHLRADVDLLRDTWSISLDGVLAHHDTFGGASLINSIRFSTDTVTPLGVLAAIDNVTVEEYFGEGPCDRLGFGDLTLGTVYNAGDEFVTDAVTCVVSEFFYDVGNCTGASASGTVRVGGTNQACRNGKELEFSNATVSFVFGGIVTDVVIPYGEYGGTVSLEVNGSCEVVENFADLDGTFLGGVAIDVWDRGVPGQSCGTVRLGGSVESMSVGGQELFVDLVSYCHECPDLHRSAFDDQTLGTIFHVGDSFVSGAATHTLRAYYEPGVACDVWNAGGEAVIENGQNACGGGKELDLRGIADQIDFGATLDWLALNYGEYGGNTNIKINGDCVNLANLSDVNGAVLGGVLVWAVDYAQVGQSCGNLYAVGLIEEFGIAGQEFYIDNIRVCPVGAGTSEVGGPELPAELAALMQNAPNPVATGTNIRFELVRTSVARLTVHDVAGRLVRTLASGQLERGGHDILWDCRDDGGRRVPAGIYHYRVEAPGTTLARRMVVLN